MEVPIRTGLFGGSFDPPTIAHVKVASDACAELALDQLWFIPTSLNPLKQATPPAAPAVRLEMLKVVLQEDARFRIETLELDQDGPSYTIDTVTRLVQANPDHRFTLVVGMDAFRSFPRWKRFRDLLELVPVVVAPRPGVESGELPADLSKRVRFLATSEPDVSSTDVRERVARGDSIVGLVPPSVEKIIRRERLYLSQS